MRVITGTARGRRLCAPEGLDVRPTTDKVKEGIFSSIQFRIQGASVLDLFAGSGQMGIEALSRGAEKSIFVDSSSRSLKCIHDNLRTVGLEKQAEVISRDSYDYIKFTASDFDIIILDPPYRHGHIDKILPLAAKKLRRGGCIICEYESETDVPETPDGLILHRTYKYGKICVTVFLSPEEEEI
jgi:16S rRNA (guanine(966)-N(2))-methyltransferase RsmD